MGDSENNVKIEQLCSRMVHDVRTPLTILNMIYSTINERFKEDTAVQDELRIMKEEIGKIDTLVTVFREKLKDLIK
jgi:signal transduction histidine kinase